MYIPHLSTIQKRLSRSNSTEYAHSRCAVHACQHCLGMCSMACRLSELHMFRVPAVAACIEHDGNAPADEQKGQIADHGDLINDQIAHTSPEHALLLQMPCAKPLVPHAPVALLLAMFNRQTASTVHSVSPNMKCSYTNGGQSR